LRAMMKGFFKQGRRKSNHNYQEGEGAHPHPHSPRPTNPTSPG
jgi:hypothetical protein